MIRKDSGPQALSDLHRVDDFSCGESELDLWLRRRALANQLSGATRTFVITEDNNYVRAYYALAAGAVAREHAPGRVRRNMPDPVPVMVLARLAVDERIQGRNVGGALLQDAVRRVESVADNVGVRALLVHATNERARAFYSYFGFVPSPANRLTLMLPIHQWSVTRRGQ